MRDWKGDLAWYRAHQTTEQIGFNPDNMCLKVCRTSRDVASKYLTAKQCQDAVPKKNRFHKVRDWRKGMKLFVDNPNDANVAGHVVTIVGRVKGFDWDNPNDVLVESNSVKAGELVVVRATYFTEHWDDQIQFAANWINGVELDYAGQKKAEAPSKPKPAEAPRVQNFRESGNEWNVNILDRAVEAGRKDLAPKVSEIEKLVAELPDDEKDTRVKEFTDTFEKQRILKMALLNQAVTDGRTGTVKSVRDDLRAVIKSIIFR